MQQRTDTLTIESLANYATWSDARLLLEALRELPFSAQADMDAALEKQGLPAIAELTEAEVAARFPDIFFILRNRLTIWRNDLMQRLHDEICVQRDYCANRHNRDYNFWTDVIVAVAGILGDLGVLALSLILVRRLLDELCDCA
jgi:hypothetical protein